MQENAQPQAEPAGWHTSSDWGTWGWAETILKLIAIAAGILAFIRSIREGALSVSGNPHLAAIVLLVLLTLAAILQLSIRLQQKETISFIFAVLNLVGHVALLLALAHDPSPRTLPIVFGVFWLLGQLTKVQWLRVTGYTEGGANSSTMLRTTVIVAVLYLVFIILVLL